MKVEKVPDSTYDMIGGLDQQIKEIKEVNHSLFLEFIAGIVIVLSNDHMAPLCCAGH
jgi:hypothetical protein